MEPEEAKTVMEGVSAMSLMDNPVFTLNVDYSRLDLILRSL